MLPNIERSMAPEKMYHLKLYFKHRPNWVGLSLALLLNFLTWGWLIWHIRPQTDPIFLHYNILFGVDFIGAWWQVFYLPLSGLVIIGVNFFVGWSLFNRDKFIALLLQAASVLGNIFLLVTAALLVFLNL